MSATQMPQIELKPQPPAEAVRFFRGDGFAVPIHRHAWLSSPNMHGLPASVPAVVEREVDVA